MISPVAELKSRVDGSWGLIAKACGIVPPPAVTGMKAVAAVPAVRALAEMATLAVSGPLTVRLKVLLETALTASVAVTV